MGKVAPWLVGWLVGCFIPLISGGLYPFTNAHLAKSPWLGFHDRQPHITSLLTEAGVSDQGELALQEIPWDSERGTWGSK